MHAEQIYLINLSQARHDRGHFRGTPTSAGKNLTHLNLIRLPSVDITEASDNVYTIEERLLNSRLRLKNKLVPNEKLVNAGAHLMTEYVWMLIPIV